MSWPCAAGRHSAPLPSGFSNALTRTLLKPRRHIRHPGHHKDQRRIHHRKLKRARFQEERSLSSSREHSRRRPEGRPCRIGHPAWVGARAGDVSRNRLRARSGNSMSRSIVHRIHVCLTICLRLSQSSAATTGLSAYEGPADLVDRSSFDMFSPGISGGQQ